MSLSEAVDQVLAKIPDPFGEPRYGQLSTGDQTCHAGRGNGLEIRDEVSGEGTPMNQRTPDEHVAALSNIPCSTGGDGTAMQVAYPIPAVPAVASIPDVLGGSGTAIPQVTSEVRVPATATHPAIGGDDGTARAPLMPTDAMPAVVITSSGQEVRLRVRPPRIDPGLAGGGGTTSWRVNSIAVLSATAKRLTDNELSSLIDSIRTYWFDKVTLQQQATATTLRAKAYCRTLCEGDREEAEVLYAAAIGKGDHRHALRAAVVVLPMLEANKATKKSENKLNRVLEKLVSQLPAYRFVMASHGLGELTFAGIIGEAGNLSNYSNPAKLWKRMGLAVMDDGRRQRRMRGVSAEDALAIGYVARRRALLWNMGNSLIRLQGPLTKIYYERKEVELEKTQAIAVDPVLRKLWGNKDTGGYAPVKHANDRAKRYMEKKVLLALWVAWRLDRGETNSPLPKGTDPFEMAA